MAEEKKPEQAAQKPQGEEVGAVTHYYSNSGVAVVKITKGSLKKGDKIHIKGHTTDFEQSTESMEIDHEKIEEAKKGQEIGMKVSDHVREHDKLYKV